MKRLIVAALLVGVGCGDSSPGNPDGGSSGGGTASGTVGGQALTVRDAVFAIDSTKGVVVALSDRSSLCSVLGSSTIPSGNTTLLAFALVKVNAGLIVDHGTGAYSYVASLPTTSGQYWGNGIFGFGPGCSVATTDADSGTVTITQTGSASGTHLKGTFSMSFGPDMLSGTFEATYCGALLNPSCGALARFRVPFADR